MKQESELFEFPRQATRLVLALLITCAVFQSHQASAWKAYTHTYTAHQVLNDVTDDGMVTLAGKAYRVNPAVVAALIAWPGHFYAGSVGPDGFPDLTYGQAVIHPAETGEWLRLMWREAWSAQTGTFYSVEERGQILAFTYGFMVHAAGDIWGHTLANDFSRGVFPTVEEIRSSTEMAGIALRHIIAEGYVDDATPGCDGNPERGPVYDWGGNLFDVSDDSTPPFPLAAPTRFLYQVLIKKSADTPVPVKSGAYDKARGPIIGFFLTTDEAIRSWGQFDMGSLLSLSEAINQYDYTLATLNEVSEDCNFESWTDYGDLWRCPEALAHLGLALAVNTFDAFLALIEETTEELAKVVLSSYIHAWSGDIDSGLKDWSSFGLSLTRGLFSPQARRDLQNYHCRWEPGEDSQTRGDCEDGVGTFDVVLEEIEPFINDHLLSMVGLPDAVGDVLRVLGEFDDLVNDVIGLVGLPFNPIEEALADVKEYVKEEIIQKTISEVIGVDIELLSEFLKNPSRYICLDEQEFTLGSLGTIPIQLFPAGESGRLDGLLGFTSDSHITEPGLPGCGRLKDDAQLVPETFPPVKNTVTMGKLLMLDGSTLNAVLTEVLGRTILSCRSNVMLDNFEPAGYDDWQATDCWLGQTNCWLGMIDGDHAWRADGLPKFVDEGSPLAATYTNAIPRTNMLNGGHGNFPLWESVVLRPAFRVLFTDWENKENSTNFPDHGDLATPDLVNDPEPPVNTLLLYGDQYSDGVNQFVGKNHYFLFSAKDTPADMAFKDDELELQYRIYQDPLLPGEFSGIAQQGHIALPGNYTPGDDGIYLIAIRSGDPCHTITNEAGADVDDPYPPGGTEVARAILDTTPPQLTCHAPPFGMVLDTDAAVPANFNLADGMNGSGVANYTSTIDGYQVLPGVVGITANAVIDTYYFYPGTRTVHVTSADHLGNAMEGDGTFEIHATFGSLQANVRRAAAEGLIKEPGIATAMLQMLRNASSGKASATNLKPFVHLLEAQRGKHVDSVTADRFMAYAIDMMARESRASARAER